MGELIQVAGAADTHNYNEAGLEHQMLLANYDVRTLNLKEAETRMKWQEEEEGLDQVEAGGDQKMAEGCLEGGGATLEGKRQVRVEEEDVG